MNLLSARPFCLLFGDNLAKRSHEPLRIMPKSKSRNGIHNEHPTSNNKSRNCLFEAPFLSTQENNDFWRLKNALSNRGSYAMSMEQITSIVAFFDWKRLFFSKSCPGTIAWSSKAATFSFFGSSLESYHFLLFQDKKKEQCRNGILQRTNDNKQK